MTGTLTVQSPGMLQCTGLVQFTNRTITGPLINCAAAKFNLAEIVARTNSAAGHSEVCIWADRISRAFVCAINPLNLFLALIITG